MREVLRFKFKVRAAHMKAQCVAHPPPLTTQEQNAREAASVSSGLAKHYNKLHLKNALAFMVHLAKYNLTWCLVPKVASSSWTQALLETEGKIQYLSPSVPPQVYLRKKYRVEPDQVSQISRTTSFLFVRHPFDRLVSAFRNKLEDSYAQIDGAYFYKTYGRSIVEKYRRTKDIGGVRDENDPHERTLDEKGNYLKGEKETMREGKKINSLEVENYYKKEPTFPEFVEYLLHTETSDYDEHWRPISLHCNVCQFRYDYIVKYESFGEEISYLVETLQEDGKFPQNFHLTWENRGGTNRATAVSYLAQVSEEKLKHLYYKYRFDFLYFGYSMENYLDSSVR